MAYLLDANVFIQAKNLHYGFDFCPAFWEWLVTKSAEAKVLSVEKVGDELRAGDDELAVWVKQRGDAFFVPAGSATVPALGAVTNWVYGHGYEPAAISTFLQVADYFLVAQAVAGRHTVVTHEIASDSRRRIKIPDVCLGLGVRCITPFSMLRTEHARFVLGAQP